LPRLAAPSGPVARTRSRDPNFRTVAQEAILSCVAVNQMKLSPASLASRCFPLEMINTILNKETGEITEYRQIMNSPKYRNLYSNSYSKEVGRLSQRIPDVVKGTNTIFSIDKADVPAERWKDIIYGRVVVNYRPEKSDAYQTRLTVGGNLMMYLSDCVTPTVDLFTVKLLLNSVVSTPGARFVTIDIKDFYLNTPMDCFEYMKLKLNNLPENFIDRYQLEPKADQNRQDYFKVRKGMYGLTQAGLLAQKLLEERLKKKTTAKALSSQVCGRTSGCPSPSPFAWKISA
jgi:hypothetical protein